MQEEKLLRIWSRTGTRTGPDQFWESGRERATGEGRKHTEPLLPEQRWQHQQVTLTLFSCYPRAEASDACASLIFHFSLFSVNYGWKHDVIYIPHLVNIPSSSSYPILQSSSLPSAGFASFSPLSTHLQPQYQQQLQLPQQISQQVPPPPIPPKSLLPSNVQCKPQCIFF